MAMPQPPAPPEVEGAADPSGDPQEEQKDDPKQLIIDVHTGLAKIVQLVTKAGAPDDVVQELTGSLDAFRSAMEKLMGSGGQDKGAMPMDSGSASMEQGGAKGAVPMG